MTKPAKCPYCGTDNVYFDNVLSQWPTCTECGTTWPGDTLEKNRCKADAMGMCIRDFEEARGKRVETIEYEYSPDEFKEDAKALRKIYEVARKRAGAKYVDGEDFYIDAMWYEVATNMRAWKDEGRYAKRVKTLEARLRKIINMARGE